MLRTGSLNLYCVVITFIIFGFCGTLTAEQHESGWELRKPELRWPPEGAGSKFPVTRDTVISSVGKESSGNSGRAGMLKVKGQQEYSIIDIDPSALKGRIITGALLHIRSATPDKAPLARLSVSGIASEWVEGISLGYSPQFGSSCFDQAEYRRRDWAYKGSTFMDVTLGRGHTSWKFAECTKPDTQGWQSCAVDADVVAARSAGISHGFTLYDDVGSTWSVVEGEFRYFYFPNRLFYSREDGENTPWLEVWTNGTDFLPPDPVGEVSVKTAKLPEGEALVEWDTPRDHGGGKTLGFNVFYTKGKETKPLPRYLVPMAGKPGEKVRMHIQDIPFNPGEKIDIIIRSVDSAGNVGEPFTKAVELSAGRGPLDLPEADIAPFPGSENPLTVGSVGVAVVDMLDKIDPQSGKMIPHRKKGYTNGNHIFSASEKRIRLQSSRNETVFFQVNLEGKADSISVDYSFGRDKGLEPEIYQFAYVNVLNKHGRVASVLPDPLVPLKGVFSIPSTAGAVSVPGQTNLSLICELYVPHDEPPGNKRGKLIITAGGDTLEMEVDLTVWNFTLPDKLSFVPEMNAYMTVSPFAGYDYYRLAHKYRTCMNRLPYGWHGRPEFAPEWDGKSFDWEEWDRYVAPLLNGSAFNDMPRKGEPVDVFYLPFNENWPVNIYDNYSPSFWAEEALSGEYRKELGSAFAAFSGHVNDRKWYDTVFQFYLNNKVYYREKFRLSSAPWVLDEPVNTQDFWALRWYGMLWRSSVDPVRGEAKMWYRGDISFSQFGRNILKGIMDIEYIGGNNAQKTRMKTDEIMSSESRSYFAEYGTTNRINTSNVQPVLWCLAAWAKGASGVLPWQTIGEKKSWRVAEQTSLFYPHETGPMASVRLRAYTAGQQLVEYLSLLTYLTGEPVYNIVKWIKNQIDIEGKTGRMYAGDAGTAIFNETDVMKIWELRYRVGEYISGEAPEYKRSLIERETLDMRETSLPDIGHVKVAPEVENYKPLCDSFAQ